MDKVTRIKTEFFVVELVKGGDWNQIRQSIYRLRDVPGTSFNYLEYQRAYLISAWTEYGADCVVDLTDELKYFGARVLDAIDSDELVKVSTS